MPKQKRVAEDYDSDDGFVEDAPKSKKNKTGGAKTSVSLDMKKDEDGNAFWDVRWRPARSASLLTDAAT